MLSDVIPWDIHDGDVGKASQLMLSDVIPWELYMMVMLERLHNESTGYLGIKWNTNQIGFSIRG